jgi:hypothetical protein
MEQIPVELRIPPAPVVALLRRHELHEPLASQISGLGFHVLRIPDADVDYPPMTKERSPPNHYATYSAAGIIKSEWVAKHTKQIPVRPRADSCALSRYCPAQHVCTLLSFACVRPPTPRPRFSIEVVKWGR